MSHACLVSTLLCFVHTLRCFYMFSGTNLLTRCHSASCLFFAVFGSRKASKEIFSELDGTKAKVNISPRRTQSPDKRWRGPQGGHTPPSTGPPWATPGQGVRPLAALLPRLFSYKKPPMPKP